MKPVSPVIPVANHPEVIYAKEQPEYEPLPTVKRPDGTILTRWEMSEDEKRQVAEQGFIYLMVMTFNQPLQPVLISADVPEQFRTAALVEEQSTKAQETQVVCPACGNAYGLEPRQTDRRFGFFCPSCKTTFTVRESGLSLGGEEKGGLG